MRIIQLDCENVTLDDQSVKFKEIAMLGLKDIAILIRGDQILIVSKKYAARLAASNSSP